MQPHPRPEQSELRQRIVRVGRRAGGIGARSCCGPGRGQAAMGSEAANAALSTRPPRATGPPVKAPRDNEDPPATMHRARSAAWSPYVLPGRGGALLDAVSGRSSPLERNFTDGSQPRDGGKRFDRTFFTPVPPPSGRPRPSHRSGGCAAGAPLPKSGTSRRHQRLISVGGAGGKGARFEVGRRAPAAAAAGETYKSVRCLATHGDALFAAGGEGCLRSITARPKGRENEQTRCISQRPTQGPGDRLLAHHRPLFDKGEDRRVGNSGQTCAAQRPCSRRLRAIGPIARLTQRIRPWRSRPSPIHGHGGRQFAPAPWPRTSRTAEDTPPQPPSRRMHARVALRTQETCATSSESPATAARDSPGQ